METFDVLKEFDEKTQGPIHLPYTKEMILKECYKRDVNASEMMLLALDLYLVRNAEYFIGVGSWTEIREMKPDDNHCVIWCRLPIEEPPYVGTMSDENFDITDFTHWRAMSNSFFPGTKTIHQTFVNSTDHYDPSNSEFVNISHKWIEFKEKLKTISTQIEMLEVDGLFELNKSLAGTLSASDARQLAAAYLGGEVNKTEEQKEADQWQMVNDNSLKFNDFLKENEIIFKPSGSHTAIAKEVNLFFLGCQYGEYKYRGMHEIPDDARLEQMRSQAEYCISTLRGHLSSSDKNVKALAEMILELTK